MMIGFSSISAVDESRAVSRFLPITITKLRCVGGTIVIQHVVIVYRLGASMAFSGGGTMPTPTFCRGIECESSTSTI